MRAFLLLFLLFSCGKKQFEPDNYDRTNLYAIYNTTEKLVIEVAYEEDAAPYVGDTVNSKPLWSLFQDNIQALFKGRKIEPQVTVPMTLEEMNKIPKQNKETWTSTQIGDLSKAFRTKVSDEKAAHYWVVFLNGYFEGKDNIIGVNLTGTTIIALFKDVVKKNESNTNMIAKYIEQSTLIHEMGHSLGLVNNGLPLTSNHHDSSHGSHCSNPNCVLYYSNEGFKDLQNFIQKIINGSDNVMFDEACLDDSRKF